MTGSFLCPLKISRERGRGGGWNHSGPPPKYNALRVKTQWGDFSRSFRQICSEASSDDDRYNDSFFFFLRKFDAWVIAKAPDGFWFLRARYHCTDSHLDTPQPVYDGAFRLLTHSCLRHWPRDGKLSDFWTPGGSQETLWALPSTHPWGISWNICRNLQQLILIACAGHEARIRGPDWRSPHA